MLQEYPEALYSIPTRKHPFLPSDTLREAQALLRAQEMKRRVWFPGYTLGLSLQAQLHLVPLQGALWWVQQAEQLLCPQTQYYLHPLSLQKKDHHSCTPKGRQGGPDDNPAFLHFVPHKLSHRALAASPRQPFLSCPSWSFKRFERLSLKFLHRNRCSVFNRAYRRGKKEINKS